MLFNIRFCAFYLLIYLAVLNRPTNGDEHSPFHDLTNIPINDHDVTANSSDSSANRTNETNGTDDRKSFFDLTGHSANDSLTGGRQPNLTSHHPVESPAAGHRPSESKCELITLPMCKGIGYNHTRFPNQLNQDTQEEAGLEVHQFYPLVEINCSDDLQLFLCLIYAPVCMEDFNDFVPPCKSICERAKRGCEPVMLGYKFSWPKSMSCDKFPEHSSNSICIDKKLQNGALPGSGGPTDLDNSIFNLGNIPIIEDAEPDGRQDGKHSRVPSKEHKIGSTVFDLFSEPTDGDDYEPKKKKSGNKRIKSGSRPNHKSQPDDYGDGSYPEPTHPKEQNGIFISSNCRCECRPPFLSLHDYNDKRYFNQIVTGNQVNCAMPCHSPYFSVTEQKVATFWITLFSCVCAVSTLLTLLTFISDTQRFQYPERCIIFLSACYLMVSLGFLLRLYVGHEGVACDLLAGGPGGSSTGGSIGGQQLSRRVAQDAVQERATEPGELLSLIRYQNTGQIPGNCLVIFWLLYYFGMCAAVWWVLLTFTWFLAAGLKWSNEAIDSYAQYFHLIAWFAPAIKAIIIVSIGSIDGDPLIGICYVGNLNETNLLIFVILPLCAYLVIGLLFLLSGFYSLFRIRSMLRQATRSKTDKLEKLMVRIVIFSVLYLVPGVIVILCNVYEYQHRQNWALSHNCQCKSKSPFHDLISEDHSGVKITHFTSETPLYVVFLLKYIMCLVVGITSGFWIWSSKTLDSWARFYGRLCCFYCCGACKPEKKTNSRELLRQSSQSMATHLMPNIASCGNQQTSHQQPNHQMASSSQMMGGQFNSNNSNRAYKLLNQHQQLQMQQQQFGAHLSSGLKSLSSSNNGSSSASHCKLPLSHV